VNSAVHNVRSGRRVSAVDPRDHHEGTPEGGRELLARLDRTDGRPLHQWSAHLRLQSPRAALSWKVRHLGIFLVFGSLWFFIASPFSIIIRFQFKNNFV